MPANEILNYKVESSPYIGSFLIHQYDDCTVIKIDNINQASINMINTALSRSQISLPIFLSGIGEIAMTVNYDPDDESYSVTLTPQISDESAKASLTVIAGSLVTEKLLSMNEMQLMIARIGAPRFRSDRSHD